MHSEHSSLSECYACPSRHAHDPALCLAAESASRAAFASAVSVTSGAMPCYGAGEGRSVSLGQRPKAERLREGESSPDRARGPQWRPQGACACPESSASSLAVLFATWWTAGATGSVRSTPIPKSPKSNAYLILDVPLISAVGDVLVHPCLLIFSLLSIHRLLLCQPERAVVRR